MTIYIYIAIGHFRVALNLITKAKLSAKFFMRKLVLFAYELMKTDFHNKKLCTKPRFHNEVQSNSEMAY